MIKGGKVVKKNIRLIAKTLFGLENFLAQELTDLGAKDVTPMNRSVEFFGNKQLLYKANIWCRTATRILKPIDEFKTRDENELYDSVKKIDWTKYLRLNQTFAIEAVLTHSSFDNSLYVSQRIKDAIADQFREQTGRRPSVDVKNPDIRINAYIFRNTCTLSLDSSGEPLFKRGYRAKTGPAPLNEVLAAGIIMHTGWDGAKPLIDTMCGSGTIVIEAALMALNIAPGMTRRKFGFMNWPDYDKSIFNTLIKKARDKIETSQAREIIGSDIDHKIINEAIQNARKAGVGDYIKIRHKDMFEIEDAPEQGVLIINPPYGERMALEDINKFYRNIGDTLKKKFSGYDAYIFTGNIDAAKHIGLRTSKRIVMYNGPTECRLLKFEMYHGSKKKDT